MFSFVGAITVSRTVILVLPKYFKSISAANEKIISHFAAIIKVFKKIGKTEEIPDSDNFSTSSSIPSSEIPIADKLIKDYLDNGLFNRNFDIIVEDGVGETDWEASINRLQPVISGKYPVYLNVFTASSISEERHLINEIHKWAVRYCVEKYGLILDYGLSIIEDAVKDIRELGTPEYLKTVLRLELNSAYIDRDIILLKRLISIVDKISCDEENFFEVFGTGYFHVVWEKVSGTVLNNNIEDFKSHMPKPLWYDNVGNSVEKESLRPDIISVKGDELYIIDAK